MLRQKSKPGPHSQFVEVIDACKYVRIVDKHVCWIESSMNPPPSRPILSNKGGVQMYASGDSLPTPWPESVIRFAVFSIFYLYFSHTWCSFPLPCCLFDRLYRVKHISQSPLSQTHNPLLLGPKIMWTRYTVFIKIDVKQCFIPARCQIISGKCWLEKLRFQRGVGAAWGGHSHCCCCWCCWDPRVGNLLITLMHLCSDIILKGVLLLLVSSWTSWSQQSPSTPGEADRGWWQVRNRGRNLP